MPSSESYIFLYIAASGNMSALNRGEQFEERLARARGRSEPVKKVETDDGDSAQLVVSEFGYVVSKSGYVMEFVEEKDTHLPAIDLAKMDDRRSYRVPTEAVESLPLHILAELEEQEYVRIMADYDESNSEFSNVSIGWTEDEKTPWDQLMEGIDDRDGETPMLDYLVFERGPDRWDIEAIADARDVKPKTVREHIQRIRTDNENS